MLLVLEPLDQPVNGKSIGEKRLSVAECRGTLEAMAAYFPAWGGQGANRAVGL